MSASITLANLAWSTPDGRPLLSGLDLSFGPERTGLVGRNGVGKTTLLKLISGEFSPQSGTISVSGRLGVLRQAVQVAPGQTIGGLFGARDALALLKRADRGQATAEELADADWTLAERMASTLGRVGLNAEPNTPLAKLLGGRRTRAALAALLFSEPDFLLLDEPTNNLDRKGRAAVIDLLAGWRAGAIVVSHDRELLETMQAIVELTSLGGTRYGATGAPIGRAKRWSSRRRGMTFRPQKSALPKSRGVPKRPPSAKLAKTVRARGSAPKATCRESFLVRCRTAAKRRAATMPVLPNAARQRRSGLLPPLASVSRSCSLSPSYCLRPICR